MCLLESAKIWLIIARRVLIMQTPFLNYSHFVMLFQRQSVEVSRTTYVCSPVFATELLRALLMVKIHL